MKVNAKAGELITDLLYRYSGQDNDQLEQAFYQLNPHVRNEVFQQNTVVVLPDVKSAPKLKTVTKSWD
ncbi:tail protein X [Photobacterium sp. DNB22_13_2]